MVKNLKLCSEDIDDLELGSRGNEYLQFNSADEHDLFFGSMANIHDLTWLWK